jgi:hypothetical protein
MIPRETSERAWIDEPADRFEVCYEAGCGYGHYHDLLSPIAARVTVAHPGQLRLIFRSNDKNDRKNAERLAITPLARDPILFEQGLRLMAETEAGTTGNPLTLANDEEEFDGLIDLENESDA